MNAVIKSISIVLLVSGPLCALDMAAPLAVFAGKFALVAEHFERAKIETTWGGFYLRADTQADFKASDFLPSSEGFWLGVRALPVEDLKTATAPSEPEPSAAYTEKVVGLQFPKVEGADSGLLITFRYGAKCDAKLISELFKGIKVMEKQAKKAQQEDAAVKCFAPFVKGRYWLYDGTVTYVKEDKVKGNEVKEQHLTQWKSEVIDTFQGKDFKAALLKGSPFDLAWYQEDQPRGDVIVWLGNDGKLSVIDHEKNLVGRFAQIKATSKFPKDLADAAEVSFNTALRAEDLKDEGLAIRYEWSVDGVCNFPIEPAVKGLPAAAEYKTIHLFYRGAPEHAFLKFALGVGITAYTYVDHGTKGNCEVNLVETGTTQ